MGRENRKMGTNIINTPFCEPLTSLLVAVNEITKLRRVWRTLAIEIRYGPKSCGRKVAEALQSSGTRWMLGIFTTRRRRLLQWLMLLFLLRATGQTKIRVGCLRAVVAGKITIAALAPLICLIAHKAPEEA